MNNRAIIGLALSASFVAGLVVGKSNSRPQQLTHDPSQSVSAAFRDGMYQGKLDAVESRKPHLAVGRWSNEEARALFIDGYQRGYHQASEAASGGEPILSVAELAGAGYRDGILDGSLHRRALQPFHPHQTSNYRAAGLAYLEANGGREEYKRFYREGYLNGYQHAYYTSRETQADNTPQ